MKNSFSKLLSHVYEKTFGEKLGPLTLQFIKNMGYVGAGFAISALSLTLIQIYLGRVFGPDVYGIFSTIRAVSAFFILPLSFVNTALVKYLSENEEKSNRAVVLSLSLALVGLLATFFIPIFYLLKTPFSGLVNLPPNYVFAAVLLAATTTVWEISYPTPMRFRSRISSATTPTP